MSIVHVILDQFYAFLALASFVLIVRQFGLMRMPVADKVRKDDRKPWNTGN